VINRKYANRVLPQVGLCISLYNILKASEGMILHQDGCFFHKVIFQMVVFRPQLAEVIEARVKTCSDQGLRRALLHMCSVLSQSLCLVHTKFFDDIRVPAEFMHDNAV
jgi:DNA-directed RNA polymerase III subunit RPC8